MRVSPVASAPGAEPSDARTPGAYATGLATRQDRIVESLLTSCSHPMPDWLFTYLSLCLAAFAAGVVNSLAGGGTLLTFPSLVAALGGTTAAERLANVTST